MVQYLTEATNFCGCNIRPPRAPWGPLDSSLMMMRNDEVFTLLILKIFFMKCNFVFLISGAHIPAQPPLSDFLLQLEDYTPTIPGKSYFFPVTLKIVY